MLRYCPGKWTLIGLLGSQVLPPWVHRSNSVARKQCQQPSLLVHMSRVRNEILLYMQAFIVSLKGVQLEFCVRFLRKKSHLVYNLPIYSYLSEILLSFWYVIYKEKVDGFTHREQQWEKWLTTVNDCKRNCLVFPLSSSERFWSFQREKLRTPREKVMPWQLSWPLHHTQVSLRSATKGGGGEGDWGILFVNQETAIHNKWVIEQTSRLDLDS